MDRKVFIALFPILHNITAENHPSYGSTVTGSNLRDLNLHIPKKYRYIGKIKREEVIRI
jgi:hypothetical protein